MEIGKECVAEKVGGRVDKNIGEAGKIGGGIGGDGGGLGAVAILDGAEGGSADDEVRERVGEGGECGGRDLVKLGVHGMLFNAVGLNWFEGADTDMEDEVVKRVAALLEGMNDSGSEVQAGCGGGDGEGLLWIGVDCLVALGVEIGEGRIVGIAVDVGRERNGAGGVSEVSDGRERAEVKGELGGAVVGLGEDGCGGLAIGEGERCADGEFTTGFKEAEPCSVGVGGVGLDEEAFDGTAALALAVEAGLQDSDGIAKKGVALFEEEGQFIEAVVGHQAGGAVDEKEARVLAAVCGHLGDGRFGEVIIKLRGVQNGRD